MSLKIKPNDGKQFVEINNYVFQNNLPRVLSAERDILGKISEQVRDRAGFLVSHEDNFCQIRITLDKQAGSLRSLKQMLQGWLELQDRNLKPGLGRRLFR